MKTALIIGGYGKVGSALNSRLSSLGWRVNSLSSRDCKVQQTLAFRIKMSDVVCLTIPTRDNGQAAYDYMIQSFGLNKPVVTAEKGALANFFGPLTPHLMQIGFTATVGGGSGILRPINQPHLGITRVCGIINGTLNFLSSQLSNRWKVSTAIKEAQLKGLCESGNATLAEIFSGEIKDVILKSAILFNLCCKDIQVVTPADFSYTALSEEWIETMFKKRGHRIIVVLELDSSHKFSETDLLFVKKGNWTLYGGFYRVETTPLPQYRLPKNEENALLVEYEHGGPAFAYGIGAGPVPTAAVMMEDILRLTE